jgi:arylsulfatase A-like enzyme
MYEGGIREPLLVRWPATISAGRVIRTPVSSPDFFPTLLDAVGVKPAPNQTLDGVSLLPLLRGGTLPERALFWHYPHYGNQGGAPSAAIRRGNWKLIEWMEDQRVELFDLGNDPGEASDRARSEPQQVAALRAELKSWQKAVGARFPTPNPAYDPQLASGRVSARPTEKGSPSAGGDAAAKKSKAKK